MSKFLSWPFWFNSGPAPLDSDQQKIVIWIGLILVVAGIIFATGLFSNYIKISKKVNPLLVWFCFINALYAAAMLFFNYELTPYLRSYIWFPIWGLVSIIWLIYLIRRLVQSTQRRAMHDDRDKEIKKYLPESN